MASRQRRPRGDGAVYYDESRDRWVGQIDLGVDALGKRVRPKVVGATPGEVRKRLKELQANNENGQDVTQRTTTFAELTAAWFQRGLSADLSDNTRENYSRLLDQHVLPALGSRRVVSLRPDDIEKVLDHLHEANYAGSTIRHALGLTRRILRFGERRGTVIRNVASCVEAPRGPVAERHGLTPSQARSLLAAAKNDRIGGLITISLLLGLRPGEAAGLTWSAVELDGETPTMKVQASLRRTPSGMVLVAPKTPTSRRTLALPDAAVDALRAQKDRQRVDQEMSRGSVGQRSRLGVHNRSRYSAGPLERPPVGFQRREIGRPRAHPPAPPPPRRSQPALRSWRSAGGRERHPRTPLRLGNRGDLSAPDLTGPRPTPECNDRTRSPRAGIGRQ